MTYKKEYTNLADSYRDFGYEKHDILACMLQTSFMIGRLNSWMLTVGEEFAI